MLFVLLDQIQDDPIRGLVTLTAFIVAILAALTFHEFSHALSATSLGDSTARSLGRLSLHPRAHLDPLGSAMLLMAGFGWAKPVPVNPANLSTGARHGMATVASAGPVANIVLAFVSAVPIRLGLVDSDFEGFSYFNGQPGDVFGYLLISLVFWNLLLAVFNFIPLAPLDGFKVALGILPREMANSYARLERHGPTILLLVIASDYLLDTRFLATAIRPVLDLLGVAVLGRHLL